MNAESCLNDLIDTLHQSARPRVWSLIITVFGDAVVPRGGVITLSALQQIMSGLDVEENAVRTALSRLTKDGWLIRMKEGRTSSYRLAKSGEGAFETATRRIYQKDQRIWDGRFELVVQQEEGARQQQVTNKTMRNTGYGVLLPGLFIRPRYGETQPEPGGQISMEVSGWRGLSGEALAARAWSLDELADDYQCFITLYEQFNQANPKALTPRQCLYARLLLIHDWRRIVLRDPVLPDALLADDWMGYQAWSLTAALYDRLLVASEEALNDLSVGKQNWDVMSQRFLLNVTKKY